MNISIENRLINWIDSTKLSSIFFQKENKIKFVKILFDENQLNYPIKRHSV